MKKWILIPLMFLMALIPVRSSAWHDETHIAIARVAGYHKWFNACGADMAKLKVGESEIHNHFVNNPEGSVVTPEMVFDQAERYNQIDPKGHLYGAIMAALRDYIKDKKLGKYGEYHLAFCAHYIGDLSMPLHNTAYNTFNREHHKAIDGVVNNEVLGKLEKIRIYPIRIQTEEDLAKEVARIANLSMKLGYRINNEDRLLTKEEAYQQISHSASLFRGVMGYAGSLQGYPGFKELYKGEAFTDE